MYLVNCRTQIVSLVCEENLSQLGYPKKKKVVPLSLCLFGEVT